MANYIENGLGWMPDLPDFRDLTTDSIVVQEIFSNVEMKFNPVEEKGKKGKKQLLLLQ